MKNKSSNLTKKSFVSLLITQFLGAFNDNAFKLVVSLYIISIGTGMQAESRDVSIAGAIFIIPFILFSTYAGCISDRNSKRSVIVYSKGAEIVAMAYGMVAFITGNMTIILSSLFLMGLQSTFFSPSKYGIMPEIVSDEELSPANGLMQMFTFLAIIIGTAVGGLLYAMFESRIYLCSIVFIIVAIIGTITSLYVERVPPAMKEKRLEINMFKSAHNTYMKIKTDRSLLITIIAIAYFWFVGALFQLNILVYGKAMMQISQGKIATLMTIIAFGIGIGSILAGRFSHKKIEFGLVPAGAIGIVLFSLDLSTSYSSFIHTGIALFLLGIFSGLFIVPLTSYLQQRSDMQDKGENIAFSNLTSFTGILLASAYLYFMSNILKITPSGIFLSLSIGSLFFFLIVFKAMPEFVTRFVIWTLMYTAHKVTAIDGAESIPKKGGALIVSNHISYIAPLVIAYSIQRPVKFFLPKRYYKFPAIRWILRLMDAVPIPEPDEKGFSKAMDKARRELANGNLVCVFPEGDVTKTGDLRKFHDGFISIAKEAGDDIPIIPAYVDKPATPIFGIRRLIVPSPLTISFGAKMPADSSAFEVRQAVSLLGTDAFALRQRGSDLLHIHFIQSAKSRFGGRFISDTLGYNLTFGKALTACITFSRIFSRKLKKSEKMVGVLMPQSCVATLLNLSLLMAGKVPVNLNYTASTDSIASAVKRCNMKTALTSKKFIAKIKMDATPEMVFIEDIFKEITSVGKLRDFAIALFTPTAILKRRYARGRKGSDLATVIFSSGSTGEPKGVMLTHLNILSNIEAIQQALRLNKTDSFCGILPFFHSFGFTVTLMLPAAIGLSVAFHPNPLDAASIGELCQKNKCTILTATPTFLSAYIKKCTKSNFDSLRLVITGAEKMKTSIAKAFHEKFGIETLEGYGCTELSPAVSLNKPDIRVDDRMQSGVKRGSIGRAMLGVSVRIVGVDSGENLSPGMDGLLFVKGSNVMKGYLGNPELTASALKDGWYNTGDIANIDEDGFITITDRLSRFSKVAGEMVPHILIENAINDILMPDNIVCVVTSVPDSKKGERLVVIHTEIGMSVDELWERLGAMGIPKLWIPKKDAFIKVDEIPLLGSGKVALKEVKELARKCVE